MHKNILIVLAAAFVAFTVAFAFAPETQKSTPNFAFTDIQGQSYALTDFKGRIVVLNFWASWCAPCVKEFPALIELAEEYPQKLAVIALSSDHDEQAMLRFIGTQNIAAKNFLVARDTDNTTGGLFKISGLPQTFIFDSNLDLVHTIKGSEWTLADIKILLENL